MDSKSIPDNVYQQGKCQLSLYRTRINTHMLARIALIRIAKLFKRRSLVEKSNFWNGIIDTHINI